MLIPILKRKPRFTYYIASLLAPVNSLHSSFIALRNDSNYWQAFTGQIIHLEYLLSKNFGNYEITISEGIRTSSSYIGHIPYSDLIFGHIGEDSAIVSHIDDEITEQVTNDFIVNVPATLFDTMTQQDFDKMKAIVNKYKLFGKKYEIVRI